MDHVFLLFLIKERYFGHNIDEYFKHGLNVLYK